MNVLLRQLYSVIKRIQLEVARNSDHIYRLLIGVPVFKTSEITPQLYLGGQYRKRGLNQLKSRGITGIVSMRMRPRKNLPELDEVSFLHLPTLDQHAPSLSQLKQGVAFIHRHLENGGKVYIHCAFGEGRGPTMAAAYLMSIGLTLTDALKQIRAVRTFIRPTKVQLQRLEEFERQHIKQH
jgi:hypothetical protein